MGFGKKSIEEHMTNSSSSSSSPSPGSDVYSWRRTCSYHHAPSSRSAVTGLLFLLVVAVVVSSSSTSSWLSWETTTTTTVSPSLLVHGRRSQDGSLESSLHANEEMEEEEEEEAQRIVFGGSSNTNKSDFSGISLPPVSAPTPAPLPETGFPEMILEPSSAKGISRRVGLQNVKLERLEISLSRVRTAIRNAINETWTQADADYIPRGPVYRNAVAFQRSYLEMEKLFRVYVYEEGEPPIFHDGPCRSIYSMEGRFLFSMEEETTFRTRDPDKAHVHFLPFSVTKMVEYIYERESDKFGRKAIKRTVLDYIGAIAQKYPYWNRSLGADHFMVSCHDWAPYASSAISHLYRNSIRVLCNANTSEGFDPSKDVTLPEINLKTGTTDGFIGGPSPSRRPILAFFAGGVHGPIRPVLLRHWKEKDEDVQVYEYLPKGTSYEQKMKSSKYCICPSGYEVASPRIVEAIYLECIPVIISDHYVLPFSDVLNWKSFSVQIPVQDIPNLKRILMSIPTRQYLRMYRRLKLVQRHFVVSSPPKRYDVFHMILHSIWLRRLNVRVYQQD